MSVPGAIKRIPAPKRQLEVLTPEPPVRFNENNSLSDDLTSESEDGDTIKRGVDEKTKRIAWPKPYYRFNERIESSHDLTSESEDGDTRKRGVDEKTKRIAWREQDYRFPQKPVCIDPLQRLPKRSTTDSDRPKRSDSTSDNEPDPEFKIELDYGNGIILQTTEQYRSQFNRFTTVNWRVSNPNLNIPEFLLNSKKKMASDIFEIITKQNDNSDRGKITCRFAFNADMVKHIMFKVPLFESYLHDDKSVVGKLYSFSVIIEVNGEWKEISSKFENGFVTFTCSCVNSFCIQSKPKTLKQVIDGTDLIINTGVNGEIVVKFKEDERRRSLTYEIERPTIDNIKKKLPTWNPKLLIAVSDKICLKFTRESLKTPIEISFPIPGSKLQLPGTEPRLIGFKKGQPSLLETIGEPVGDKMLFKLNGYDGSALALVQLKDNCYVESVLTKELEIFYGGQILCNIILFVTGKPNGQIEFMANCVLPYEKQSVIQTTTNSGARCIFESDTLCLHPLQRIRIQVGGKIKEATGYSKNLNVFLTFVCESKSNFVKFPVATKACGKPYAIIEFALDNINSKDVVSFVHFDLYGSYKIWLRYTKRF